MATDKVFVTHSRHDAPILRYIKELVHQAQVTPVFFQYDANHSTCAWEEIREEIRTSNALFVVLSNNLSSSPHTQNWVGTEVGIAAAFRKPTWVFEELHRQVSFPIPYLTDYLPYNLDDPQFLKLITYAASSYNLQKQRGATLGWGILWAIALASAGPAGPIVGGLLGGSIGNAVNAPQRPPFVDLMCYHLDCKTRFRLYVLLGEFECPSCRRMLRFDINQLPDGHADWLPMPRYGELAYTHYAWFGDNAGEVIVHKFNGSPIYSGLRYGIG